MDTVSLMGVFFEAISGDRRISVSHIGVYAALIRYWEMQGFEVPVYAFSHQIMELAKISSIKTYQKCIRDLSVYGYLKYEPSFKRNQGSRIYLLDKRRCAEEG